MIQDPSEFKKALTECKLKRLEGCLVEKDSEK